MDTSNTSLNCNGQTRYLNSIIKSESEIAKCLENLLCDNLLEDLKKIEPIEKRVAIIKNLLYAYSQKECAMAKLVNSARCKHYKIIIKNCDDNNNINYLFVLLLLFCFTGCFCFPFY